MKIGISTTGMEDFYTEDEYSRLVAEAGFDGVDADLIHLLPYQDIRAGKKSSVFCGTLQDALEAFRLMKKAFQKYSLTPFQAHAPFPSWIGEGDEEYDDWLLDVLKKTIAGCAEIGCQQLVIHPFFLQSWQNRLSRDDLMSLNLDRYGRLIPEAEKYGVRILTENMFTRFRGRIFTACCSEMDFANELVDALNAKAGKEMFGFCLDTGHLQLLSMPLRESMLKLGSRIKAFHVHDNDGLDDLHTAPFLGIQDWNELIEGLRQLNWTAPLCFETIKILPRFPEALHADILKLIADTGRLFASRVEEDGK